MDIYINGKQQAINSKHSVEQIILDFNIEPSTVVVELNKQILTPEEYNNHYLTDGDRLELIRFVGGG